MIAGPKFLFRIAALTGRGLLTLLTFLILPSLFHALRQLTMLLQQSQEVKFERLKLLTVIFLIRQSFPWDQIAFLSPAYAFTRPVHFYRVWRPLCATIAVAPRWTHVNIGSTLAILTSIFILSRDLVRPNGFAS
jgi:hypothetical protein